MCDYCETTHEYEFEEWAASLMDEEAELLDGGQIIMEQGGEHGNDAY